MPTYYMYSCDSSNSEYRGFSVFDLTDLTDYPGATVTSGCLQVRNCQRLYALTTNFYILNSIPKDGETNAEAKNSFNVIS